MLASGDDVDQQITHACDSLSEETTGDDFDVDAARPVLEFIPIKKSSDGSSSSESGAIDHKGDSNALGKKSDWLSSAQLWNESPDLPTNSEVCAFVYKLTCEVFFFLLGSFIENFFIYRIWGYLMSLRTWKINVSY